MITRPLALLLCVTLALPGCASARFSNRMFVTRQASPASSDAATMGEYVRKLQAGSRVRVETTSGKTVRGILIKATDDAIVVQRNTRVPVAPEPIAIADIARVMPEPATSSNGRMMAIGASIGAGAAIGVVWLITAIIFAND